MFSLIIFSGPSGSGKSTIAKEIIARHKHFSLSVSSTTRAKREQEIEGKDKLFISKEEFLSKISQNAFFEYVEVFGNYYGTSKDFIFQTLKTSNVILDIEYLGAEKIKEKISEYNQTAQEKIQLLTIFILPDDVESLQGSR
jgi:guanylate kinase